MIESTALGFPVKKFPSVVYFSEFSVRFLGKNLILALHLDQRKLKHRVKVYTTRINNVSDKTIQIDYVYSNALHTSIFI